MSQPVGQPNHTPQVDIQEPTSSPSPEVPQLASSASRIRRKRKQDGLTIFSFHQYQYIKQRNPEMTKSEIYDIIKTKWATMDEDARKPYSELAESQEIH
ncbi:hypothetical protein F4679DRAFT_588971 [Xylaria curta]|nr:hypothetical protein F4679DRAFT_588971 [Xylaria curta]